MNKDRFVYQSANCKSTEYSVERQNESPIDSSETWPAYDIGWMVTIQYEVVCIDLEKQTIMETLKTYNNE